MSVESIFPSFKDKLSETTSKSILSSITKEVIEHAANCLKKTHNQTPLVQTPWLEQKNSR